MNGRSELGTQHAPGGRLFRTDVRLPLVIATVADRAGLGRVLAASKRAWDIVEIRADCVGWGPRILRCLSQLEESGIPVIITLRHVREGGQWKGQERHREIIFEKLMNFASAIDVELASSLFRRLTSRAHQRGITVIGSFHDFEKTPPARTLERLAQTGWRSGADVVKIATRVRTAKDVRILLGLLKKFKGRLLCVIGMSENRPLLRVKLARAGSCFAYGHVGRAAAPGQMSCTILRRRLFKA